MNRQLTEAIGLMGPNLNQQQAKLGAAAVSVWGSVACTLGQQQESEHWVGAGITAAVGAGCGSCQAWHHHLDASSGGAFMQHCSTQPLGCHDSDRLVVSRHDLRKALQQTCTAAGNSAQTHSCQREKCCACVQLYLLQIMWNLLPGWVGRPAGQGLKTLRPS